MGQLSEQQIERAAYLCSLSYDLKARKYFSRIDFFEADNIFGFVQYADAFLEIVFTGSNDPQDWWINFNFRKTKQGIHRGWWDSYKKIKSQIDDILDTYPSDFPLYIYGHSAGGALAGICALFRARKRSCYLITFGQPKFCNQLTGDRLMADVKDYARIVNWGDIVPMLPIGNYIHVGRLLKRFVLGNPHSIN